MRTVEIDTEAVLSAADVISKDVPIFMINLLRYKEQADYGERTDFPACSGREAYFQRYVPAFNKVAMSERIEEIKVFFVGDVLAHLVAPSDEQWDDVAIVEYPDFAAFRRLIESRQYASEADYHRKAALEDWRLIVTTKMELPG